MQNSESANMYAQCCLNKSAICMCWFYVHVGWEGGHTRGSACSVAAVSRKARRVRRAMKSSACSQNSWRQAYSTSASSMGCPRTSRFPSFCSSAIRVICFALSPYAAAHATTLVNSQNNNTRHRKYPACWHDTLLLHPPQSALHALPCPHMALHKQRTFCSTAMQC